MVAGLLQKSVSEQFGAGRFLGGEVSLEPKSYIVFSGPFNLFSLHRWNNFRHLFRNIVRSWCGYESRSVISHSISTQTDEKRISPHQEGVFEIELRALRSNNDLDLDYSCRGGHWASSSEYNKKKKRIIQMPVILKTSLTSALTPPDPH